jgi:hypothetical protein
MICDLPRWKKSVAQPGFLPENTFFSAAFLFDLIHLILWGNKFIKEGTMGVRFMVVLAGLVWQCFAIQINVDTVFTSSFPWRMPDSGARFTIRNTNSVDTIYIDTVYIRKLSSLIGCNEISFQDSVSQSGNAIRSRMITINNNDTVYVSRPDSPILIPPHDSLIMIHTIVGNCLWCTGIQAANYSSDQCVLKATFIPSKGARDSVVFIGPKVSMGTKFKTHSNLPMLGKGTTAMKLYDLSGRYIDKAAGRKTGVYIETYGRQGALIKKLMIRD